MNLKQLKSNWENLGESDPYWAVCTDPKMINNKWDVEDFYKSGIHNLEGLYEALDLDKLITHEESALDFGCGPGRLTQALCKNFNRVVGVDISSSMIRLADIHNQFPNSCTYLVNDQNNLSQLSSGQFNLVLSLITLQHIEEKFVLDYIKEFVRVLKEEGFLVFNMPTEPPLSIKVLSKLIGHRGLNWLRKIYYRKNSVIEMHWIEEIKLVDFFREIGLEVIKIKEDKSIGKGWQSNLYLLKKPSAN